jgi:ATP-dependent Lhr-like helicase
VPPTAEGRWTLTAPGRQKAVGETAWAAAAGRQLLTRNGVVTRESIRAEALAGGFAAVYPVFKVMEEAGKIRRGYFIAGLGATQFAVPGALDLLRSLRDVGDEDAVVAELAATDPANPYGAAVPWPASGPMRAAGATVWLVDGAFAAYLARGGRALTAILPAEEPARSRTAHALARALAARAARPGGLLIAEINGAPPGDSPLARYLVEAGLTHGAAGFHA